MASTYYLHQAYGPITAAETGTNLYAKVKYNPAPVIQQGITNYIYAADATSDYLTYTPTGLVGYFDSQFGMKGAGSARYILDGSTPTPNIKFPSSSYYDTGASTYKTGSLYVWSKFALTLRLDMQLQDGSGNSVGGVDSTTVTLVPEVWTRIETTTTANAQKFLMTLNVINFDSATMTGQSFYIDGVQVENNRYATVFHNSPTRIASQMNFTLPKQGPDYTITCWARMGNQVSTAAAGVSPFFTLYNSSTDYAVVRYNESSTSVQAFKDDTDPNTDFSTSQLNLNPGDLVFVALVNDGLNLKVYVGKDGGSLINASATTDFGVFDQIMIGKDPVAGTFLNGPVEQFIMHRAALDSTAIESIFTSATPLDYTYSTNVIFAYAVPSVLGMSKAQSYSGVGNYRYNQNTVSLDIMPASLMSSYSEAVGLSATHMAYGNDVSELELNGYMMTSTDLSVASIYKILQVSDIPGIGKSAYLGKM